MKAGLLMTNISNFRMNGFNLAHICATCKVKRAAPVNRTALISKDFVVSEIHLDFISFRYCTYSPVRRRIMHMPGDIFSGSINLSQYVLRQMQY